MNMKATSASTDVAVGRVETLERLEFRSSKRGHLGAQLSDGLGGDPRCE
jgi:hypothetical protein